MPVNSGFMSVLFIRGHWSSLCLTTEHRDPERAGEIVHSIYTDPPQMVHLQKGVKPSTSDTVDVLYEFAGYLENKRLKLNPTVINESKLTDQEADDFIKRVMKTLSPKVFIYTDRQVVLLEEQAKETEKRMIQMEARLTFVEAQLRRFLEVDNMIKD